MHKLDAIASYSEHATVALLAVINDHNNLLKKRKKKQNKNVLRNCH